MEQSKIVSINIDLAYIKNYCSQTKKDYSMDYFNHLNEELNNQVKINNDLTCNKSNGQIFNICDQARKYERNYQDDLWTPKYLTLKLELLAGTVIMDATLQPDSWRLILSLWFNQSASSKEKYEFIFCQENLIIAAKATQDSFYRSFCHNDKRFWLILKKTEQAS